MKHLNIDWLYSFKKLAETGNFNIASSDLNITVQTLSYHIRSLEDYFGFEFIERRNKNNNLTLNGVVLLKRIEDFLISLDKTIINLNKSNISFNIIQSTNCNFDYCLSDSLISLHKKNQDLKMLINSILFFEIEKFFLVNKTDLAICSYPINNGELYSLHIAKIPYVIAQKSINNNWNELKYISCEYHLMRTNYSDASFYSKNNLELSMTVSSLSVAVSMAKRNLGAVYLPILDIEKEIISNELDFIYPIEEDFFDIYVVINKNNNKSNLINDYVDILITCIKSSLSRFDIDINK
jgi:DNA-binding transcriptional LysR family regulator